MIEVKEEIMTGVPIREVRIDEHAVVVYMDQVHRVIFIIGPKFTCSVPKKQGITQICRIVIKVLFRFCPGNRIVTVAAVEEVAAPAAVDNVVRLRGIVIFSIIIIGFWISQFEGRQVDGFLEFTFHIDVGDLNISGGVDTHAEFFGGKYVNPIERFAITATIPARVDPAIITKHTILACATRDPVVAISADKIIVLAFAEEDVITLHAVHEVVP